jgi:hypothetical protein
MDCVTATHAEATEITSNSSDPSVLPGFNWLPQGKSFKMTHQKRVDLSLIFRSVLRLKSYRYCSSLLSNRYTDKHTQNNRLFSVERYWWSLSTWTEHICNNISEIEEPLSCLKLLQISLHVWYFRGSRRDPYIFQTIVSQMVVRLLPLRIGTIYPQEESWYSFLLETKSKNPMTWSGIEPANFRLVA